MSDLPEGYSLDDLPAGYSLDGPPADASWGKRYATNLGHGMERAALLPQGVNEGLYQGAMFLPDMSGRLMKAIGLSPKDGPLPSEMITGGHTIYNPNLTPENPGEKAALATGNALGSVASTAGPASIVANTIKPAVTMGGKALQVAAPTYGQTVADTLASNPGMQIAATTAGNVTGALTDNPWLGLGASGATAVLGHGAGRVTSAAPTTTGAEVERRALLGDAQKANIPVSFGDITDSYPARMVESVLSKLPFVGNRAASRFEAGKTAFDKAAIDQIPEVKGEGIDAATLGNMKMIAKRIGNKYDSFSDIPINIDPQVGTDLAKARAGFSQQLESQMPGDINKQLRELETAPAAAGNPQIDGATYKNIRSKLSAMMPGLSGGDRDAVVGMIDALDGALERSAPKDIVQDVKDARESWRKYLAINGAVDARSNGGTAVGHIPPGALWARAGNDADLNRLGQVGTKYVGDKMPDSGTALRQLILNAGGTLGAGGAAAMHYPVVAGALAGGGLLADTLLNNPYTRKLLVNRLQNPSEGVLNRGLVATLAGQQSMNQPR